MPITTTQGIQFFKLLIFLCDPRIFSLRLKLITFLLLMNLEFIFWLIISGKTAPRAQGDILKHLSYVRPTIQD